MASNDSHDMRFRVANYFIEKAGKEGVFDLTHMKLQKLVYFAYGWYLALRDKELFKGDFQPWSYGPVDPQLYEEFKHYGSHPIVEKATQINWEEEREIAYPAPDDKEILEVLDKVWSVYGNYSASILSKITHLAEAPWHKANENGDKALCKKEIKNYFVKDIRELLRN